MYLEERFDKTIIIFIIQMQFQCIERQIVRIIRSERSYINIISNNTYTTVVLLLFRFKRKLDSVHL